LNYCMKLYLFFSEIILPEFAEQGDHKVNSNIVKLPENKSQIYN